MGNPGPFTVLSPSSRRAAYRGPPAVCAIYSRRWAFCERYADVRRHGLRLLWVEGQLCITGDSPQPVHAHYDLGKDEPVLS